MHSEPHPHARRPPVSHGRTSNDLKRGRTYSKGPLFSPGVRHKQTCAPGGLVLYIPLSFLLRLVSPSRHAPILPNTRSLRVFPPRIRRVLARRAYYPLRLRDTRCHTCESHHPLLLLV
ncbi:hypothetical protein EXIGLDRAFT_722590, partial [Exidia glandulosa HHB12029]